MSVTTASLQILRALPYDIGSGDVAASTTLYQGAFVCYDTSGNIVNAADTAGYVFAGLCVQDVDNSAGSAGDLSAQFYSDGVFKVTGSGFAAPDVGMAFYILDNQTLSTGDGAITEGVYVGVVEKYFSTTRIHVRLDPTGRLRLKGDVQTFVGEVAGVNATTIDLTALAAMYGGTGIYVTGVNQMNSITTSSGAFADRLVVTTDYTLAAGALTQVGDKSANTLQLALRGRLKE